MAQSRAGGPAIRTPDHLLRVFVSSTLGELAAERRAARAAIERLHLAPVMFELGARPHPPRKLYRSYLEQSDVFVGIYWERYGWIAPGEEISGLEDEYDLASPSMPKLIYLKASQARDERLQALIRRIQSDDTASYLTFETDEELRDHLARDLATLLAERFQAGAASLVERGAESLVERGSDSLVELVETNPAAASLVEHGAESLVELVETRPALAQVPPPYTPIVGRETEIDELIALLEQRRSRVVTIVGAGGTGKSRLAIEVALRAGARFSDGVVFVPLENVLDPQLLLPTIGQALGIGESGDAAMEARLPIALARRQALIVLDNFEQIGEAAPALVSLYSDASEVAFLVTSRAVLRIRGEHVFELDGLPTPSAWQGLTPREAALNPAVQLFVERARAVKSGFELTEANVAAVAGICAQLEGLPLAIELAAARVRVLTPQAILARLDHPLALLASAARDLPQRQRTLEATIQWSADLLSTEQRGLLADLSVFAPGFGYAAVEALGRGRAWAGQELEGLSSLVDNSLLHQGSLDGNPRFAMLSTVREFGVDLLREHGELALLQGAHADHYLALARELAPLLRGAAQVETASSLEQELPNLRAAVRYCIELGRLDDAAELAWSLLVFWWFGGYFGEVRVWMQELLARDTPATPHARAVASFLVGWVDMWLNPSAEVAAGFDQAQAVFAESRDLSGEALATACAAFTRMASPGFDEVACRRDLERAVQLFEAASDTWGAALALVGLGRLESILDREERAAEHYLRAGGLAREHSDTLATLITDHHIGRSQLFAGQLDVAERTFRASVELSHRLGMDGGVADGLEGLSAIAAARGQAERAGLLSGAAAALRQRLGFYDVAAFVFHERYLDAVRQHEPFAASQARGQELTTSEAVAIALAESALSLADPLPFDVEAEIAAAS